MLIFQDIVTGDELFSDEFDIKEVGGTYVIECAMILPEDINIDISNYASEEDAQEDLKSAFDVNNVAHYFRLQLYNVDKKNYIYYMRRHFAQVMTKMGITEEADVKAYGMEISPEVKKVCDDFQNYYLYTGESDGSAIMHLSCREDGTQFFTVLKHAVEIVEV
ncbi:hypothetical protein BGX30_000334 [Mortierella sp. GBA39]|nr:hypothetical protein BGX30_000334 [Mortierella sp. GBA39]